MTILALATALAAEPDWIGKFQGGGPLPAPWSIVRYGDTKPTSYRQAMIAKHPAIEARFDRSIALFARPIKVDLAETPILCWRWFVQRVIPTADLKKKSGNDFAARVYVAFDMPASALSGPTKLKLSMARKLLGRSLPDAGLAYVWDNRARVGTAVKSPYTDRLELIVAQTGNSSAGTWVAERADVAADFARAFGGKPGRPINIAVAADGDNTGTSGVSAFADLHFVRRADPCRG